MTPYEQRKFRAEQRKRAEVHASLAKSCKGYPVEIIDRNGQVIDVIYTRPSTEKDLYHSHSHFLELPQVIYAEYRAPNNLGITSGWSSRGESNENDLARTITHAIDCPHYGFRPDLTAHAQFKIPFYMIPGHTGKRNPSALRAYYAKRKEVESDPAVSVPENLKNNEPISIDEMQVKWKQELDRRKRRKAREERQSKSKKLAHA